MGFIDRERATETELKRFSRRDDRCCGIGVPEARRRLRAEARRENRAAD